MENVAYMRVSSVDQNFDRQFDGMPKDLDKQFLEKASGAENTERKILEEMIDYVRQNDHVWIHSLDRLARSMTEVISILNKIHLKGVSVTFIKEGLTLRPDKKASHIEKLMLGILNSFSEFERSNIKERQADGIRKARERGVYVGRKKKHTAQQREEIVLEAHQQTLFGCKPKKIEICRKYGIAKSTFQRYEKEVREKMRGT